MRRRIALNLVLFGGLATALILWGMANFLQVGPLRPAVTGVVAEFEESPGLQPGFPVTYQGIQVGEVAGLDLAPGMVHVGLELDPTMEVPRDVTATVRRRSVVGEPYVGLDPKPGVDLTAVLVDGDRIALEDTNVLISYEELFATVDDLLAQIPADDLNTIIEEVSIALDGQVDTARGILDDLEGVTGTLADRSDVLESLTQEVTRLTGTVADSSGSIAQGLDNTAVVAALLEENTARITRLLESSPDVLDRTSALIREMRPPLECALASAANIGELADPRVPAWLEEVFDVAPDFGRVLESVVKEREDGSWVTVRPLLDEDAGPHDPLEFPTVRDPAECERGGLDPGDGTVAATASRAGGDAAPTASGSAFAAGSSASTGVVAPSRSELTPDLAAAPPARQPRDHVPLAVAVVLVQLGLVGAIATIRRSAERHTQGNP